MGVGGKMFSHGMGLNHRGACRGACIWDFEILQIT